MQESLTEPAHIYWTRVYRAQGGENQSNLKCLLQPRPQLKKTARVRESCLLAPVCFTHTHRKVPWPVSASLFHPSFFLSFFNPPLFLLHPWTFMETSPGSQSLWTRGHLATCHLFPPRCCHHQCCRQRQHLYCHQESLPEDLYGQFSVQTYKWP